MEENKIFDMYYEELAPSKITADAKNKVSQNDILYEQYKKEFNNTPEGKNLIVESRKTPFSKKKEWNIKYEEALEKYIKTKNLNMFKNGGSIRKYQISGALPSGGYTFGQNSSPKKEYQLEKYQLPYFSGPYTTHPNHPTDEMALLNQKFKILDDDPEMAEYFKLINSSGNKSSEYQKFWFKHPELRERIGNFENLYSQMQELYNSNKATVGQVDPKYTKDFYDYWTKQTANSQGQLMELFADTYEKPGFINRYYSNLDENGNPIFNGPLSPREQRWTNEFDDKLRLRDSINLNHEYGVNYTPDQWDELKDYINNGYAEDVRPNLNNFSSNWGTYSAASGDHRSNNPRYQEMANKYGPILSLLDKERLDRENELNKQVLKYGAEAAGVGLATAVGGPMAGWKALSAMAALNQVGPLYRSYKDYGKNAPVDIKRERKNRWSSLILNGAFLGQGSLAKWGTRLALPSINITANGVKFYKPNLAGKIGGYIASNPLSLYFAGEGIKGATDLLGSYTWNKNKYTPEELKYVRRSGLWNTGFGAISALGLRSSYKQMFKQPLLGINGSYINLNNLNGNTKFTPAGYLGKNHLQLEDIDSQF